MKNQAARVLALMIFLSVLSLPTSNAQQLQVHAPIIITADSGFTVENGVVRGEGTVSSPYLIEGWAVPYVIVRNTTSHFVVKNIATDYVTLYQVAHATILGSEIINGDEYALKIFSAADIVVESNTIYGVVIDEVRNIFIAGNRILGSAQGVGLDGNVTDIVIIRNNIAGHFFGIRSWSYGGPIVVSENNIFGNAYGVAVSGPHYRGLSVFHNNFFANGIHATFWEAWGDDFTWDNGYPSGGNYWEGYGGMDVCNGLNQDTCPRHDGIGDSPYNIDVYIKSCPGSECTLGSTIDRYPLMKPVPGLLKTIRLN